MKLTFGRIVSTALMMLATVPAQASTTGPGFITTIHALVGGTPLFIQTGSRTAKPACATSNRWAIPNSSAGQSMLSILLTAYAQGKRIWIVGTGTCPDWGDSETVSYFYIDD